MKRLAPEEGMIARAILLLALVASLPLVPATAAAREDARPSLDLPPPGDCLYVDLSQTLPDVYIAPC